ncbi:hypothetical protein [Rubrivirga sp. IMCC43871]|uniref:hypothetical protein n=1 Tax=Rubrivirga sp. IMCC43871 TaxID=3391575 RepID=UPI00398FA4E6
MKWLGLAVVLLSAPTLAQPAEAEPPLPLAPPAWVANELRQRVGRWEADNAAYQSDDEPQEAYVIEWSWGVGQTSLRGRLFGLIDGDEVGTYWEFRQYWHPGTETFVVEQFGYGGVGVGHHAQAADGVIATEQTFYRPDGTVAREGHRSRLDGDTDHSASFIIEPDGSWTPGRSYVWHRVSAE